jgi:hypothetical protein
MRQARLPAVKLLSFFLLPAAPPCVSVPLLKIMYILVFMMRWSGGLHLAAPSRVIGRKCKKKGVNRRWDQPKSLFKRQ